MTHFQKKGQQLVNDGRVVNIDFSSHSSEYVAHVYDQYAMYTVKGNIQDKHTMTCHCSDFKFYNDCAHVWATKIVLPIFLKEKNNRLLFIEKENTKQLIASLQQMTKEDALGNISNDIQIDVDIQLHFGNHLVDDRALISAKIGTSKLFVVKRFEDLLLSYYENTPYPLGKYQMIYWETIVLSHEQQQLFDLLDEAISFEPMSFGTISSKFLSIHPLIVPKLLKLAQQCTWINVFVHTNKQDLPIEVMSSAQPLVIQIGQSNEQLLVKLTPNNRQYFASFKALLINNQLYLFNTKQHKLYIQLLTYFDYYDQMIIAKEQWHQFLSYALPLWKQIATVKVDELVLKTIQQKAKPILSLKQVDDVIEAKIEVEKTGIIDATTDISLRHQLNAYGFELFNDTYHLDTSNTQALHHFLSSGLKQLEEIVPLSYDKNFGIANPTLDEPIILANQHQSLLDINFNINGISQKDVENILKKATIKEPIYRLENGLYVDLDDDIFKPLHSVLSAIRGQTKVINNNIQVNRLQAISITEQTDAVQFDANINEMVTHLRSPELFHASVPQTLQAQLKDYQLLGFKWLKMLAYHQLGGILADEMGLGKTLQSIAYILSEIEESTTPKTFLILSPASLVLNWVHEWQRFAPQIKVQAVLGDKQLREQLLHEDNNVQVFVTSYQSYRQDSKLYQQKEWHTIILDESQYIKNYSTKIHQSLRQLNGTIMFALSGTPIENKKEDLWSIFSIILPGLFPNIKAFKQLSNDAIAKIARPFILRRLKHDVLTELPQKIERIHYNELTKEQKALYLGYLQQMQEQISQLSDEQMSKKRIDILAGLTRLRQICNHPSLFIDNYDGESGKLLQCLDLVKMAIENGHRVLLFSQFASMLTLLEKHLHHNGIETFTLTGQTPTTKRLDIVNAFNSGEKDVFLISLKAGGTGLNLTGADTIILYDLWWNPAVEDQATARAHRIGQDNIVHVYRLVSQGTIEEKMLALQEKKKALFDDMIFSEQTETINRTQLTNEDIKEILGIV